MNTTSNKILLSRADLKALGIVYSNVHLLRLELLQRFPRRIYLSPARVAWLAHEINNWIEERAAERDRHVQSDLINI